MARIGVQVNEVVLVSLVVVSLLVSLVVVPLVVVPLVVVPVVVVSLVVVLVSETVNVPRETVLARVVVVSVDAVAV
jgi:hypothetical protein